MGGHDHDDHDAAHEDGNVPLYCRPVQRQKWGEAQILPHTEWGNTFFDLFYVAGAYNLGTLLKDEPTSRGILYFAACFFPLQNIWQQKMYFDSRFATPDDVYHKLYEFAVLVVLGTAVLHIRPVAILSDPRNNIDMFCFSLSLAIAGVMGCGRSIELYFMGVGQPALKTTSVRDFLWSVFVVSFYTAAAIVSGLEYYGHVESADSYFNDTDYGYDSDYGYADDSNKTSYEDKDDHRGLAGSESSSAASYYTAYEDDVPIYLMLIGSVAFILIMVVTVLSLPGGGKHKEIIVPMNITFGIHRWGEFTMLMLGESVLSLLIVDVTESGDYYKTFFCGIISITLLEFLHFRSQPHDADDHALRRSKEASIVFTALMQIYSASLVVLGASYKMLLYEYTYEAKETGAYRLLTSPLSRLLAGSDESSAFEVDERRQHIADFFCISMAIVWLCSDLMIINHRGLTDNLGRCRFTHTGFLKFASIFLVTLRLGMVIFIATLSQYVTQPSVLAGVGLAGIVGQICLRVVGSSLFGPKYDHANPTLWPNVTRPEVEEKVTK